MGSYYYGYGFGVLDVLPFGCLLCQIVKSLDTLKDTCKKFLWVDSCAYPVDQQGFLTIFNSMKNNNMLNNAIMK